MKPDCAPDIVVVGGGLAGCEAAWQLAHRGFRVRLFEMRPFIQTPAHSTAQLAEIVCSNSFGGEGETGAPGILKAELELGGSLILQCAHVSRVPAGRALAVDRERFSELVSAHVESHPRIEVLREEMTRLPDSDSKTPLVIATGPLTSFAMAESLQAFVGGNYLSFFDAAAPIVTWESIDMEKAYAAGRYGQDDDYINCPMNREEYGLFYEALVKAERVVPHSFERGMRFEKDAYFEGCMPVEVLASRGMDTLRFGPMKPVGLPDPRTGREPYAVAQLRRDNREGTLYNLVGFQTGLKWGEQSHLIHLIPGLENAEIARFGVMHRNIYVNAPVVLDCHLRLKKLGKESENKANKALENRDIFLAGQLAGVEGYMESTAMGLVAGVNAARLLAGGPLLHWPRETAIGSLLTYLQNAETGKKTFQPMNVNLGIFPSLPQNMRDKKQKARAVYSRAIAATQAFWGGTPYATI
ncbi:MAG: methylenetetrahydrofolate--tRNA-(uracil(54)-C(5))-methyltransferase (FADH(2)-oxidizing) TrmFO [Synergistaceae bacterium]|jgi:methylenetetrahydrofolate--tRNA-(uracil-5-)-methyltransferase|nr:methylenetetrahydrofolate--tRNA-(uracil(54)-C(5))-methyltransferase (FADH(2)-oxidizing) TrmFO [Synergistaceae bacterium]